MVAAQAQLAVKTDSPMAYPLNTQTATATRWAAALRGVVILSGGVRPNELVSGLGRSMLDLPFQANRSLLVLWRDQVSTLASALGRTSPLPLRAIVSRTGPLPTLPSPSDHVEVTAAYEKIELRGTGGLLRDLAEEYADDDALLVAHGNQVLVRPLPDIFNALSGVDADIVLHAEPDGSSSGVYLMRCGVLKHIRANGYIDLKEQALSSLAAGSRVRVVTGDRPSVLRVRTLDQYIRTLRALTTGDAAEHPDPYAEEWARTFSLVEDGALVDPSAVIHDSVVMRGARVGPRAVVVRSLVCAGASVRARSALFDTTARAPAARQNGGAA